MSYSAALPQIIRFGSGVRADLPEILPPGDVMIICGRHSAGRLEKELLPRLNGKAEIFCVPAEIPLSFVAKAVSVAENMRCSAVVGWGGGSAMDAAKAVAALMYAPESVENYFYCRAAAPERKTFLALLPTTAGTGAEVTANAVLCDEKTGIKQSLRTPGMSADAALVDPELLMDAPPEVIAASGMDALTQALESFVSSKATSFTKQLALNSAALLFESLLVAFKGDENAFEKVARGSLFAGMALAASGLGAVHGIGHPLGSVLHIGHGTACAGLLAEVMRYNLPYAREVFSELACGLAFDAPEKLICAVENLRDELGIAGNFRAYGLSEKDFDFIVANCRSGSMRCNPAEFSDDDVRELLRKLI